MGFLNSAEKTYFQVHAPISPEIDIRADSVIVYGLDSSTSERIENWRKSGYETHFMTGLAWGEYQDYLNGKYDGKQHWDETQTTREGVPVLHGPTVPYMVPTISFTDYLTKLILPVVDMGIRTVFLEEPEFFVKSGYSKAFKQEWEIFYKEPWQPPHSSVDAQYKASKLKSYLFKRCLFMISTRLKNYAKQTYNENLKVYLATHSLINYSQWEIISPEEEFTNMPEIDGFIAQIWTGTSRVPNVYNGIRSERTFATAYLEYGIMQELVQNTDKDMIFLHDPIEDDSTKPWTDYQQNYFKSVVASLFHPKIHKYEVCPWPDRIFKQKYPRDKKVGSKYIPCNYKTILLTIMNTLRNMNQSDISWANDMSPIGVFMSNTAMYQRQYPDDDSYSFAYADSIKAFSAFYGLALPLVMKGIPVRPLQLENIAKTYNYLSEYKIVLLSYEYMKPQSPAFNYIIASWVRQGGILIYVGEESDSFNNISEWWKDCGRNIKTPSDHLFDALGMTAKVRNIRKPASPMTRAPKSGVFDIGRGIVAVLDENPAKCAQDRFFSQLLLKLLSAAAEKKNIPIIESNYFMLNRGPYKIIATFGEESDENLPISGNFIDLFSEKLEYETFIVAEPDSYFLFYDLDTKKDNKTEIIAISAKVCNLISDSKSFTFTAEAPPHKEMVCACRIYMEKEAVLTVNGEETTYKREKNTIFFNFGGGKSQIQLIYTK